MKRNVLTAIIIFAGLCLTYGFTYHKGQNEVNIQLNIKDLPAEGGTLITPSDPAFDVEVASLVSGNSVVLMQFIDAAKPFCVFIKNTSKREIAGYRLKWELLSGDGKIITKWSSSSSPNLLSRDEQPSRRITADGVLPITPGNTLFVSLESVMADFLYSDKNSRITQTEGMIKKRNELISQLNLINKEQTESVIGVTVTFDCAYFEDGTFVGPDTGNLFAETQGYIDAQRDLGQLVRQHVQDKKGSPELFNKIKAIADEPDAVLGSSLTLDDYKKLFLKSHARNFLKIRDKSGDDSAIKYAQRQLDKTWIKLQRKVGPT